MYPIVVKQHRSELLYQVCDAHQSPFETTDFASVLHWSVVTDLLDLFGSAIGYVHYSSCLFGVFQIAVAAHECEAGSTVNYVTECIQMSG